MAATRSWECELSLVLTMIARMWHGWTKPADAPLYEQMLREEIFPGIAARNIPGYGGAELFIREGRDEVEFVTLLRFESMEAVKTFAGNDAGRPVIYAAAEPLLIRMDEQSLHYRIVV
jgi:antibiotic biosynthesis monooxygenase (ABM) superfamily enzyme